MTCNYKYNLYICTINVILQCKDMENSNNSIRLGEKKEIMTLKGYYKNLPEASYPKTEFIRSIAKKCDVSEVTVRNWINYGFKPTNKAHIQILSEETGIPSENLWEE